tara:strand:+ start:1410 stop:1568 length:159 start_codon:yes stop_codon:yes gene_type:complete
MLRPSQDIVDADADVTPKLPPDCTGRSDDQALCNREAPAYLYVKAGLRDKLI